MKVKNKKKIARLLALGLVSVGVSVSIPVTVAKLTENNVKTSSVISQPQGGIQHQVGFINDGGPNDKRYVVWQGDDVSFKYDSSTQKQDGQFSIWNEWYFNQTDAPDLPIPNNKDYMYYEKWQNKHFWGSRPRNRNKHNIPNKYEIKNASLNDQGFYNLQYNYTTGNGAYGHHRFSAYPFQVIVCPTTCGLNIKMDNKFNTYKEYDMGTTPDIDVNLNYDNNSKFASNYLDKNNDLVHVKYMWQVKTTQSWENVQTSWSDSSHLPDFDFKPGTYQFRVTARMSLTENNNVIKHNKFIEHTSNEVTVVIRPKISISGLDINFHDDLADFKYNVKLNDKDNFDEDLVRYSWYKQGRKDTNWSLIANENSGFEPNRLRINLKQPGTYKMVCNYIKNSGKPVVDSPIINVLKPYEFNIHKQKQEQVKLFQFKDKQNSSNLATYTIFNQNLQPIVSNGIINQFGEIPSFTLDTSKLDEKSNFYMRIYNPKDGVTSLCLLELSPIVNTNPTTEKTNNNHDKDVISPVTNKPIDNKPSDINKTHIENSSSHTSSKFYKQWWFYLIIVVSLIGLGVGGYYLTKYLMHKIQQRSIERQEQVIE